MPTDSNAMSTPMTAADSNRPEDAKANISKERVRTPGAAISTTVLMSRMVAAKTRMKTETAIDEINGNITFRNVNGKSAPDTSAASSNSAETWLTEVRSNCTPSG